MISAPVIQVRCDQILSDREPCRRAQVFTLPSFVTSKEHAGNLFAVLNPDWAVTDAGTVYCPQCRKIAEARLLAQRAKSLTPMTTP